MTASDETDSEHAESAETESVETNPPGRTRRLLSRTVRVIGAGVKAPVRLARKMGKAAARKPRTAVAILATLVVVLGAASGYLWHERQQAEALSNARAAAVETAGHQVPKLLSYNGQSIAKTVHQSRGVLTQDFGDKYAKLIRNVIGPAAKKQDITTKATVTASSVVTATTDKVVCLLFVNQSTTAKQQQPPKVSGSRVRVQLQMSGDRWLISQLKPV